MPPKKKIETQIGENGEPAVTLPTRSVVRPKDATEWHQLMVRAEKEHWRRLRIDVRLREKLLAGKPAKLDTANIMLKARGLEDQIAAIPVDDPELRKQAAAEIMQDEGLCEFHRRSHLVAGTDGRPVEQLLPGIWFPTNNLKAGVKENWSVLGLRVEHRGSRGALAEGVFVTSDLSRIRSKTEEDARLKAVDGFEKVEADYIYLGAEPHGVHEAVAHTMGPQGPKHSVKRHEYLLRPEFSFIICIANAVAEKLPDNAIADMLVHFGEHGMGACRSQGFGRFDVLRVCDLQ